MYTKQLFNNLGCPFGGNQLSACMVKQTISTQFHTSKISTQFS